MRVLIITSGGYLENRVERVLSNNDIKGDVSTKLSRDQINRYDCVIFSYNNDIPNLPKLIETIVLERKIHVVFINNTPSIGYYYNLVNDLFFSMVNENTLDIELPLIIKSNVKYTAFIVKLELQINHLEEDVELLKLTNKAKLILMSNGLSEAESHKFIQRKSMSMRVSKRKLVNLIIENKIDI